MTITLKEVEKQFNEWNVKAFGGELPLPNFELMTTKSLLGQFRRRMFGSTPIYTIRISTYYDRPLESYIDTIVHEMLHYYIRYKGIKDSSSHGREWKHRAAELSKKFGLTITTTNPAGGGVCNAILEKKMEKSVGKFEYVFLCQMIDGHFGAAVVSSGKIQSLRPRFNSWKAVKEYVIVKAPWSQTYKLRHLRTACGVGYISKKEYVELLNNKVII